jgi:hypothetical protein
VLAASLSRPGDGVAAQVGARRRSMPTPGPVVATSRRRLRASSSGMPWLQPLVAAAVAASAASAATTRLPMEGRAEMGREEVKEIGGNGLLKA